MDLQRQRLLRDEMRPFMARNDAVAYGAVLLDFVVYLVATAMAVIAEPLWLKALSSVVAGTMIATLFVLGHDAGHGSLVSRPWMNRLLGRLLFFPALHNYTLWRIQHNRLHHQAPNVKGLNSWSPFSPAEYQALPAWRRFVERVYRGGGFGLYYLLERWWKHKFHPFVGIRGRARVAAWSDFALLLSWLTALIAMLLALASAAHVPVQSALLWGFAIPYLVWNSSMGLTVFLHHTHVAVPWFRTEEEARRYGGQEELTIHVRYPRWYGVLSHEIMVHPPHHLNPLIPFYQLQAAQRRLVELLGDEAIVEPVSFRYVRSLVRRCKLYDYDRQEWTDFSGRTTGQTQAAFMNPQLVR